MKKVCIILAIICVSSFIISGVIFSLAIGTADFNAFSRNVDEEYYSAFNSDNIKISGVFKNLTIIPYEESDIKATLSGNYKSFIKKGIVLNMRETPSNFHIELEESKYLGFINLGLFSFNIDLTIYIPNDYNGDITIDGLFSKLSITDLDLSKLVINGVSGDINISDVNANKINIDGLSGEIILNNITGDLNIDAVSGDILIKYLEFDNKIDINSLSASINIEIPKGSDRDNISIDSLSGEIKIIEY